MSGRKPSSPPSPSRFVVGIDLGTTNSAVAFCDTAATPRGGTPGEMPIRLLLIPQLTAPGTVEERTLLPSFLYLAPKDEESALRLPWGETPGGVAGAYARKRAAEVPERVVSSAKSWLSMSEVDRTAPILPWTPDGSGEPDARISPVAATAAYLAHLRGAWDAAMASDDPAARLSEQEVFLTVPASFDAAARELTVKAAAAAGLKRVVLLEEPQAAVYAYLEERGDAWRRELSVGDLLLVVDIGGGTTDFSLVTVLGEEGELSLHRVAVGDHLLLGGDNMDLALALSVRERLARDGKRLDAWQLSGLIQACREAKETLLAGDGGAGKPVPASVPLVILGRGRKLVGGTVTVELTREEAHAALVDGFFPNVALGDAPSSAAPPGLGELGLAYASDPAVTRHLSTFLGGHLAAAGDASRLPTVLLFNGGVTKAAAMRDRVTGLLAAWAQETGAASIRVLQGTDPEHAVARGAAYHGLARRGKGVRIRGGAARSYYVGVASAMPSVPGREPRVKGLCVLPFGVEEGTESPVAGADFGLLLGQNASFRFYASSTRLEDRLGLVLDEWETEELAELAPLTVTLEAEAKGRVPVRLSSHFTEVGTLELWFHERDGERRWKLEIGVRERAAG